MFMPFQALDHSRELAQSELPDAPVVEHFPVAPRPNKRLRLSLAMALHALARRIAGENNTRSPELCPTELAH